MGWVPETQLPEEAREAIKKVQDSPRAVTPIISRNNRFSIYRVLEWKPQEEKTYDEVKEDVKKMLLAEQKSVKTDHLLAELRQKSKINISELLQQVATPSPSPEASPTASPQNQQ